MVPCVFTGKTEFMTIPVDGRRHVALMMIPPHLLDRYLPGERQQQYGFLEYFLGGGGFH